MRYRTKLLGCFAGLAVATNATLFFISYEQTKTQFRHQIESQVLSIAATAALAVDGDLLAKVCKDKNQDSANYRHLERHLRSLRDVNRRHDVHVKFIYTVHETNTEPPVVCFGVDGEESGPDKSNLGDVYDVPDNFQFKLDAPFVYPDFSTDAWGTWVTAQAPVRDRSGHVVGLLGVDVAAQDVIDTENRLLASGAISLGVALILSVVVAGLLATRVAKPLAKMRDAVRAIGEGHFDTVVTISGKDEFGEVGTAINDMAIGLLQRENLKGALARYVSADITQQVLDHGEVRLQGERRYITVLFADIRGFTTLSERAEPETVVFMLNDFYSRMIDAVMSNHGLINKFLGDGLMAMFGAPRGDEQQELHAVSAALAMQEAVRQLQADWHAKHSALSEIQLEVGIGIHSGEAVVGNVGSTERIEYTAIGDTVNLASRLEAKTKEHPGVNLLVSDTVFAGAHHRYAFRSMGEVSIRGRQKPVHIYTPMPLERPVRATPTTGIPVLRPS